MNSLRSAWTPFLAGRPILIRRRREKPKLEQPILSRDILTVGLVQNTGQTKLAIQRLSGSGRVPTKSHTDSKAGKRKSTISN